MGAFMSTENHPHVDWQVLLGEVRRLGEDFELEFAGENNSQVLPGNDQFTRCMKYPGHPEMVKVTDFDLHALPELWRVPELESFVKVSSRFVVKINTIYVSKHRPSKGYSNPNHRGKYVPNTGTGFAQITEDLRRSRPIDCPLKNCRVDRSPHKVTAIFDVVTAAHVVFDESEAETATVDFFYDSQESYEAREVVKCHVVRMEGKGMLGDTSTLHCISHDLSLFHKLYDGQEPLPVLPAPFPRSLGSSELRDPLVLIISHPHGYIKHVSVGHWLGYDPVPSEYQDSSTRKISEFFQEIEDTCPDWENTGYHSEAGEYWSPELVRHFQMKVFMDLDTTFGGGAEDFGVDSAPFPSISYSTATCPGSSGARMLVLMDKGDGTWDVALRSSHFRHLQGSVNGSGEVTIVHSCKELVWKQVENLPTIDTKKKRKKKHKTKKQASL